MSIRPKDGPPFLDIQTLAKNKLWRQGRLEFKLHAGQRRIDEVLLSLKGQLQVICCSRQFGKTYYAVTKAIGLAIKKPRARIKIGTAFLTDLTEIILPAFDSVLDDCPESMKPTYKKQGSKYVFPNGSEIKLVGLDKSPNGLRGTSTDMVILEEAGFISNLDYLFTSVIVPTTTHRPDCKIILISTPPSTPAHPFAETYVPRAKLEGSYACFTIYDNPMVDEATIQRLAKESGGFDSTTFKREYLCEFILDDNLALVREWRNEFIQDVPKDEFYQYYHKLVGMDLGRQDATALIFGYYDFRRAALVIEDELTMEGTAWTTLTLKDAVLAKEKELWGDQKPMRRISDTNNPHLLNDLLTLYKVNFIPVTKDSSLEQMVNRVREWTNAGRILVNPRCKMLIGNLQHGIWDKHRKGFERSKVFGHFDHFAALQYTLIMTPLTNPIPHNYGFDVRNSRIKNRRPLPESASFTKVAFPFKPTRKI